MSVKKNINCRRLILRLNEEIFKAWFGNGGFRNYYNFFLLRWRPLMQLLLEEPSLQNHVPIPQLLQESGDLGTDHPRSENKKIKNY